MLVETHSHCSEYSPDSGRPLARLLQEAAGKGFSTIVLTDHFDKDYCSDGTVDHERTPLGSTPKEGEWVFDLHNYTHFVESVRTVAPIGLNLLRGIEVGYRKDLAPQFNAFFAPYEFEQIIGSIHAIDDVDLSFTYKHPIYQKEKKEAYAEVLKTHIDLVESPFDFDILAHFDYMTRYVPYDDPSMLYADYEPLFDRLLKGIISRDIALEINNRTRYKAYDKDGIDPGPCDRDILERYYELGGRLITLASDTHETGTLGRFFPEVKAWLRDIGFKEACFFKGRQPQLYKI